MDITPVQMFWYAFGIGMIFALFPFLLTMRDFINPYFSTRFGKGKRLLAVHSNDGMNIFWKVGFLKDGLWQFKFKKGDVRAFTISDGCAKRTMGINMLHIQEGVTAPFNFKLVTKQEKEVEIQKVGEEGELLLDNEENPLMEKVRVVSNVFFDAYDDSRTIIACLESALSKKASKSSLSMGNIDIKRLLIIAAVVVGGWFVIKNFVLSGQIPVIK